MYSHALISLQLYCDFSTGGGAYSWTMMTGLEQPGGSWMTAYPAASYTSYFNTAATMWILGGNSDGRPNSPDPAVTSAFRLWSLDWSSVLVPGRSYMLRQRFFRGSRPGGVMTRTLVFDVGYSFIYTGYLLQDQSSDLSLRAWTLTGRTVFADTTGILWDIPAETIRFWLPFTSNVNAAPGLYTGCNSFSSSTSGCTYANAAIRRMGSAGIIGAAANSNDPAASWAPFMDPTGNYDIVHVHQASGIYGNSFSSLPTTTSIFLSYYISPLS